VATDRSGMGLALPFYSGIRPRRKLEGMLTFEEGSLKHYKAPLVQPWHLHFKY
jgi:hypothetical protein